MKEPWKINRCRTCGSSLLEGNEAWSEMNLDQISRIVHLEPDNIPRKVRKASSFDSLIFAMIFFFRSRPVLFPRITRLVSWGRERDGRDGEDDGLLVSIKGRRERKGHHHQ
jgi:hypothetical protein